MEQVVRWICRYMLTMMPLSVTYQRASNYLAAAMIFVRSSMQIC